MGIPTSLGEWIRNRRKMLGLTQEELAQRIGCAGVTIRKLEADERRPSHSMATLLAAQLELTDDERSRFLSVALDTAPLHMLIARTRSNLPSTLAPIIGRSQELAAGVSLLERPESRLLSIVGPGGIGKTTFALHLACAVEPQYADGVFVVDLSVVETTDQIPLAITATLGLPQLAPHLALPSLCSALREQAILLVLDNFEHLMDARALVADLLKECFWLAVIVTSRQPLLLRREQVMRLAPLSIPNQTAITNLDQLANVDSMALFLTRAQAVNPSFELTSQNALALTQLCGQLDGIPLAIELVAAQCALLDAHAIQTHLSPQLAQISDDLADRPVRHRSVHAAIAWGFAHLTPAEQQMLVRLAVFQGGWTIAAAEAVCGDAEPDHPLSTPLPGAPSAVLHILMGLLTKSMITQTMTEGHVRFGMLSLIRSFALNRFGELADRDEIQSRHARYFASLLAADARHAYQPNDLLMSDYDNFQAALRWSAVHGRSLTQQLAAGLAAMHQHTLQTLQETRAVNIRLEDLVAQRTAALEEALRSVEAREHHLQQANAALIAANQAIDSAHRLKTDFMRTISYDIHTVLNIILGFSYLIPRYGPLADRQAELLDRIRVNSDQFIELFSDISDLIGLEHDTLDLRCDLVSVADVVEDVAMSLVDAYAARGLTLRWLMPPLPPVRVDRQRFTAALRHMLAAVGGWTDAGDISVGAITTSDGYVRLWVGNTGPGFSADVCEMLFQPFVVLDEQTLSISKATQVGLALSKQALAFQGGRLWIESVLGRGSTLLLELPIAVDGRCAAQ